MKTTKENRGMIDGMMVASTSEYIAYGSVRGLIGEYDSARAARAAVRSDSVGCGRQGGYSDACVYCWDEEDGWVADAGDE